MQPHSPQTGRLKRQTAASLMLTQGVPARVVMQTLGHSQIAITLNTYSHVAPELSRSAADRMQALLGGAEEVWLPLWLPVRCELALPTHGLPIRKALTRGDGGAA